MKWLRIGIIVAVIGAFAASMGIAEDEPDMDISRFFKQSPLQSEQNELEIIRAKTKQYGLTDKDAEIIEAIRRFYATKLTAKDTGIRIMLTTFQANIAQMIDWACIHFTYIHRKYDVLEPKPDYIDYIFDYFFDVIKQKFSIGTNENIKFYSQELRDFVRNYIKANYKEVSQ